MMPLRMMLLYFDHNSFTHHALHTLDAAE